MASTTTRNSATVGQGGMSNLQGFQAHPPPTCMGGGDLMVMTSLAIEREVDDTRSIRDMGASDKRKDNQSSSHLGKKTEDFYSMGISEKG